MPSGGQNFTDLTGIVFERLTVVRLEEKSNHGAKWLCRCQCDKELIVFGGNLKRGNTKSCGCLKKDVVHSWAMLKGPDCGAFHHGATCNGKRTPEFNSWRAIIERCTSLTCKSYPRYGGSGITVCERWQGKQGFENFLADVGPRPEPKRLYSIDRYPDKNGNYEPGNCRWATPTEQSRNRRSTKLTESAVKDIKRMLIEGISQRAIAARYDVKEWVINNVAHNRCWAEVVPSEQIAA